MNFNEFLEKINRIKEMGFVESNRVGDTGIGKTLEDLLGITENNIAGPDFDIYELKSGRKDSSSMLTLFTKTPMPKGAIKRLLETFGYKQRTKRNSKQLRATNYLDVKTTEQECSTREKELHVTVDSKSINSVGLKLEIRDNRICISNTQNVDAYYEERTLKEAFEKKYKKLILVLATSKKEKDKEWFWFSEAYLLEGFSFKRFSELVEEGIIKLDLRIGHYPNGNPHDHGTGFRVLPKDRPKCFKKIVRLI